MTSPFISSGSRRNSDKSRLIMLQIARMNGYSPKVLPTSRRQHQGLFPHPSNQLVGEEKSVNVFPL